MERMTPIKSTIFGVQTWTPISKGARLLPKGAAIVTILGANLDHYFECELLYECIFMSNELLINQLPTKWALGIKHWLSSFFLFFFF